MIYDQQTLQCTNKIIKTELKQEHLEKIKFLKNQGKSLSYISSILKIPKSTVHYNLMSSEDKFKLKINGKTKKFNSTLNGLEYNFSTDDAFSLFETNPICNLSGAPIDWNDTSSFHFDHIKPRSRGGSNKIKNLQFLKTDINLMKNNMTNKEFINACSSVSTRGKVKLIRNKHIIKNRRIFHGNFSSYELNIIKSMSNSGMTSREISKEVKLHHTTISRKLRNSKSIKNKNMEMLKDRVRGWNSRVDNNKRKLTIYQIMEAHPIPVCGLTKTEMSWDSIEYFNFDHIIPVSLGGESSLENLQILCLEINIMKRDIKQDNFIELCRSVHLHNN